MSGAWGDVGCFSAHPLKNLNAIGDAGYLTTNNEEIAKKVKLLSNHGLKNRNIVENFGYVSRMDIVQAAILVTLVYIILRNSERLLNYLDSNSAPSDDSSIENVSN